MSQIIDDEDLKRIYAQPGWGHTDAELAERFGVGREAIFKRRRKLKDSGIEFTQTERGRYRIDGNTFISNIKVSTPQSLVLYVAARRLSRNTRLTRSHVQNALEKLAMALYQPMTEKLVKAATEVQDHPDAKKREVILEELLRSWSERIKVKIRYQGLHSDRSTIHIVSPYLIEPSPWSDSVYLIGHSNVFDAVTPFKIERIEKASLTTEHYEIDPAFEEETIFQYAWGIWDSDKAPEPVRLRFTGREAVRRLKESIWHPKQKIKGPEDESYAIWEAPIAEWREMVPWVRGWGKSVIVLDPPALREALQQEARLLAERYGWIVHRDHNTSQDPFLPFNSQARLLWAKTNRTNQQDYETHPLICHLIDVAQMALALWSFALTDSIRAHLTQSLGVDSDTAGKVIAFWAGLHDLGKAAPIFQRQYEPAKEKLAAAGLKFGLKIGQEKVRHATITTTTVKDLLIKETSLPEAWAWNVATALGGHHNSWPTANDLDHYASPIQCGDDGWEEVRRILFVCLKEILDVPTITPPNLSDEQANTFFTLFSGLTTVADWLGSMEDYFRFVPAEVNLEHYPAQSATQARQALQENGWLSWQPPTSVISFQMLCNVSALRPLQETVVDLAPRLTQPALVIIEAPTGIGKTEAALYLADHWAQVCHQQGMYIAMPTMATSNQMFGRVQEVLARRYPERVVNYQLLHGNALLLDEDKLPRLATIGDADSDGGTVAALDWFTKRKRGLLAPFGVGTVDQALLSILQTPHFFVRLFGLSHKTVIFDEVHAYDTYMEELFYLLLKWLRMVGASVVILSATLPEKSRLALLQAYTGDENLQLPQVKYPALTWTMGGEPEIIPLEAPDHRTVSVERIPRDPEAIAQRIEEELQEGGCIAVICNTVGRAQEVYQAIQRRSIVPEEDNLILFHARMPFAWRNEVEQKVLHLFDKNGNRPQKAIVVATQVIEQSLDLDFDLMVSDLAPIDLILQRLGRLHRHEENNSKRGMGFKQPRLLLAVPPLQDGMPIFDRADTYVYERYVLLRSYLTLCQRNALTTPDQTQDLIESVYGDEALISGSVSGAMQQALVEALEKMNDKRANAEYEAWTKLISEPDDYDFLRRPNSDLDEDNPELHRFAQAATRLAPPSTTLVCLHQMPHGLFLDPDPNSPAIDLTQEPNWEMTRKLFSRKITVSDYRLVKYFANQSVPPVWQKNVWLRHTRLVIFENGIYPFEGKPYYMELDRTLGLMVKSKEDV